MDEVFIVWGNGAIISNWMVMVSVFFLRIKLLCNTYILIYTHIL